VTVKEYCAAGGGGTVPPAYLPASQDCAGISDYFGDCGTFLPVELMSFTATQEDGSVELKWSTASEQNSELFVIDKSTNGEDWERVGSVAASGYSAVVRTYSLLDQQPFTGESLYRLRQVDQDGGESDFVYAGVNVPASGLSVTVSSTLDDVKVLICSNVSGDMSFHVYDLLGRRLQQHELSYLANEPKSIGIGGDLQPGSYLASWSDGDQSGSLRFVRFGRQ
jgi:hypothetical protein